MKTNREIKFRAWDGKEMHTSFLVARPQFADALSIMTDEKWALAQYEKQQWRVMQFTGEKDKNSKEIFEGDVLKNNEQYHPMGGKMETLYAVVFEGAGFYPLVETPSTEFEIVGNIYENPDLMK